MLVLMAGKTQACHPDFRDAVHEGTRVIGKRMSRGKAVGDDRECECQQVCDEAGDNGAGECYETKKAAEVCREDNRWAKQEG